MAKMIDSLPQYYGEQLTWHAFSDNLPKNYVVYNTRSIKGYEYDFCVMAENIGLFIVEVKGWNPEHIISVINPDTILIEGEQKPVGSPLKQARGYSIKFADMCKEEMDMNPLVMSMVCYPRITRDEYYALGLNIVSHETETVFSEELNDPKKLLAKFLLKYDQDKPKKHTILNHRAYALIRHYMEPNYNLKEDESALNPSYSRLRIISRKLNDEEIKSFVSEYCDEGIKEILFTSDKESYKAIIQSVENALRNKRIMPKGNDLVIGSRDFDVSELKEEYTIFNLAVYYLQDLSAVCSQDVLIEEGQCTDFQIELLKTLSEKCSFNLQQFLVEHAPTDQNILVTAGAGTGKTYSMVSRVAYLCNKTVDPIVDIVRDLAMITFTSDAAENMRNRLKQMFMNYFTLTSNSRYLHFIEDLSYVEVSTIHKFAISILRNSCLKLGLGNDFDISNETYDKRQIYRRYLNDYISEKMENDPTFINQLPFQIYELEDLLLKFSAQLYNKSIDVKGITQSQLGDSIPQLPFFNELIETCVIPAEKEYYAGLTSANKIDLQQSMILLNELVKNAESIKHGMQFRFVFVDEFQDTDDTQIDSILNLQKVFGDACRLFVVGDLKQSIYRFRGATSSAFAKVKRGGKEWYEYSLVRNYRTDERLLDKYHVIFSKMGNAGLLPYNVDSDRLVGNVQKECNEDELIYKIDSSYKKTDLFYDDLFNAVKKQLETITDIEKTKKLSDAEKTIAILVRYNYQIESIVKEAKKRGIYVEVKEGGNLYRLPSTFDLYKLTMAILNNRNSVYLANLIWSNYVSVKPDMSLLYGLNEEEKLRCLTEMLNEYFMLRMGKTWGQIVSDFATRPVLMVLREIYECTQPWQTYNYSNESAQTSYRSNYELLLENLTHRFSRDYLTLNMVNQFLQINITTYQEAPSRNIEETNHMASVICTTIHKSKGLEYGTVILPFTFEELTTLHISDISVDMENGKIQYGVTIDRSQFFNDYYDEDAEIKEQKQEESRLLYVALTRAIRNFVWIKNTDNEGVLNWGKLLEAE